MAHRIVMPSFGMYTAEGNLGRWLRPNGSRVETGEIIADIVTEKATYELESPVAGLLHQVAAEGENLQVEGLIGWILEEGEPAPDGSGPKTASISGATGPAPASPVSLASPGPAEDRVRASPTARKLAAEAGVDLANVTGTGPGGRIVEADVRAAAPAASREGGAETGRRIRQRIPLRGARKIIGERLRRALDTAVSLTLTREARVEALVEARGRFSQQLGSDVSYDALLLKVFADALRERPDLHAIVEGDEILLLEETNLCFAVSLPDSLAVPVVRDVDRRPLSEIARDVRDLAERARAGALRPPDVLGGTATITNLGASGIDAFTPVLNPPQSVILGIGRIAPRPVVEDGRLGIGTATVLSLTFDHRVADGAAAASLLAAVARRLGDPAYFQELA